MKQTFAAASAIFVDTGNLSCNDDLTDYYCENAEPANSGYKIIGPSPTCIQGIV